MKAFHFIAVLGASIAVMGLVSRGAQAGVIVTSAIYGVHQAPVPGFSGPTCYQRSAINLKDSVNAYCSTLSVDGICRYKVPWPSPNVDPGFGCYKSFEATYKCSTTDAEKTKSIGGYTDGSANKIVEFDCSPAATRIGLPSLQSNGATIATAEYAVAPGKFGQPDANGKITILPVVTQRPSLDNNYNPAENYLKCGTPPILTIAPNGIGYIGVEYQVTGYSNLGMSAPAGESARVTSAKATFSLKVNGTLCSGAFDYDGNRQPLFRAAYFLQVNGLQIPLNLHFQAPQTVSPKLIYDQSSSGMLTKNGFISAAMGAPNLRTRNFGYDLVYRNEYGLAAAENISCTFGDSSTVSFATDANTGRVQIRGTYTVAQAGRDSNGSMTWAVTTSLTGDTPIFTLQSGQSIGSVTCKSSDNPPVVRSFDLGTW